MSFLFILAIMIKYDDSRHKGVIMKNNVSLFAGPNEQYHALGIVPLACQVQVQESKDQWCKIKSDHGCGWVLANSITVI